MAVAALDKFLFKITLHPAQHRFNDQPMQRFCVASVASHGVYRRPVSAQLS